MLQRKILVEIRGTSPLLMHAFPLVEVKNPEKLPKEEQAEMAAYRDPDTGDLYLPGIALQRALVAGGAYSKGKGRATLQKVVAACVQVTPERISLGTQEYAIDARPVVIPATKGRVMRFRPRIDVWQVTFVLEYDGELMTEGQMRQVVDDTGARVGLLDFRPATKGPFGRYMVVGWEIE